MNTEQFKDIDAFEKLLTAWKETYQWKISSYVAIKTSEGPRLLFGRIRLEPLIKPQIVLPFQFESEHIIAGREIIDIGPDAIDAVVGKAKTGEMTVSGRTFSLIQNQGTHFFMNFSPIYRPGLTSGPRLPTITIRGGSKNNLLSIENFKSHEMFDWELKASDQPFDTLEELHVFLELPGLLQMGDMTTLEIEAKSPAMISNASKIKTGQASIRCLVAPSINVQKIKLGYKIFRKGSTDRSSVKGSEMEWKDESDYRVGYAHIPIGDAPVIQCFLSYDGIALHQWLLLDPQKRLNLRHAIHEIFDEDLEVVKRLLFNFSKNESRAFEEGVALLFNMLGFSVSHHGRMPKLQEGPDIIVITPRNHIGIIECTIGLLNEKGKLAKLVQRTKLIKEKLATTGYGHLPVQPVIVSALSRTEVEAHLEEAGKNGIAVVCKENLENLITRIGLPPNPDSLFREAMQLIPGIEQTSLYGES